MKPFDILSFVQELVRLSPRQLRNEVRAARLIERTLDSFKIPYREQVFTIDFPSWSASSVCVDRKKIPSRPSGFISGVIRGTDSLISSLTGSQAFLSRPNINFNPRCRALSSPSHYFAPAVSVRAQDVGAILGGRSVVARMSVRSIRHRIPNILVGNALNPQTVCFAHYDCIETGAVDNASGVAAMMAVITRAPGALARTLFVFSACEELSFDKPIYWGYGFRVFEKKNARLLEKATKIIVVDCVGNDRPRVSSDPDLLEDAFPIKNIRRYAHKTVALYGSIDKLMPVYHSALDDIHCIVPGYMEQAIRVLARLIGLHRRI